MQNNTPSTLFSNDLEQQIANFYNWFADYRDGKRIAAKMQCPESFSPKEIFKDFLIGYGLYKIAKKANLPDYFMQLSDSELQAMFNGFYSFLGVEKIEITPQRKGKCFTYKGIDFVIQAYDKGVFANICPIDNKIWEHTLKLDYKKKKILVASDFGADISGTAYDRMERAQKRVDAELDFLELQAIVERFFIDRI